MTRLSPSEIDALIDKYRQPFVSAPLYTETGDALEYYFEDADSFAERVNPTLTLHRAFDDRRIIGFSLHAFRSLLANTAGWPPALAAVSEEG